MSRAKLLSPFLVFPLVAACAASHGTRGAGRPAAREAAAGDEAAASDVVESDGHAKIQIIGLSDFHGWLLPLEPRGFGKYYGGIANLGGLLEHKEHLRPESSIILDNGDMWTGPTEATFLRGKSVIRAYNALGVAAANVANHEFDFGVDVLRARAKEATFPFLGANIVKAGTQDNPDFVKPWIIAERDGTKVGIVGLGYIRTKETTLARHVADLEFLPYATTLRKVVPEVRAAGAGVIVVLFHDTVEVVEGVLKEVTDLQIDVVIAGQNHRKAAAKIQDTLVVNPGPFGRSYVRFDLDIDRKTGRRIGVEYEIVDVVGEVGSSPFPPSLALAAIAESARQEAKGLSSEVLGRAARPLPVGTFADSMLGHFIVDTWLSAIPAADAAICNHGGIRQPLPAGPITIADLMAVLPFENNLYLVALTGKEIKTQLAIDSPVVAGLTWTYRERKDGSREVVSVVDRMGNVLDEAKTYRVAINDFMYHGGDGFTFKTLDPEPVDTGLSWRAPVLRALRLAEDGSRPIDPRSGERARIIR